MKTRFATSRERRELRGVSRWASAACNNASLFWRTVVLLLLVSANLNCLTFAVPATRGANGSGSSSGRDTAGSSIEGGGTGAQGNGGGTETGAAAASAAPPHVAFAALPLAAHVAPLRELAVELLRRGFRVSFAMPSEGRQLLEGASADSGLAANGAGPRIEFVELDGISSNPFSPPVRPNHTQGRARPILLSSIMYSGLLRSCFELVLLCSILLMAAMVLPCSDEHLHAHVCD